MSTVLRAKGRRLPLHWRKHRAWGFGHGAWGKELGEYGMEQRPGSNSAGRNPVMQISKWKQSPVGLWKGPISITPDGKPELNKTNKPGSRIGATL
jgi:hypothetical protein